MNRKGEVLFIGVDDNRTTAGLESDNTEYTGNIYRYKPHKSRKIRKSTPLEIPVGIKKYFIIGAAP